MMRNIVWGFILLCGFISCKKEGGQPQSTFHERMCNQLNPYYVERHNGDSAVCWIPNSFSPNGDGNNDVWAVGVHNIALIHVEVRDSNQIMFVTDSIHDAWFTEMWWVDTTIAEKNYDVQSVRDRSVL